LIIVDEAQDTSSEQWACIKLLAENSQVICLADLDQVIYDHLPGVRALSSPSWPFDKFTSNTLPSSMIERMGQHSVSPPAPSETWVVSVVAPIKDY
jgi:hypothetical protein